MATLQLGPRAPTLVDQLGHFLPAQALRELDEQAADVAQRHARGELSVFQAKMARERIAFEVRQLANSQRRAAQAQ